MACKKREGREREREREREKEEGEGRECGMKEKTDEGRKVKDEATTKGRDRNEEGKKKKLEL